MATNNRYTPHFKAYAVGEYRSRRAKYPDESPKSSLRIVSTKLDVPESTLAGWTRVIASDSAAGVPGQAQEQAPMEAGRGRGRFLDVMALAISIAVAAQSWFGFQPFRDTQEQERNAQSYVSALTAPSPASYGAMVTRLDTALNYTEEDSPAARVLALLSEVSRAAQRSKMPMQTNPGSAVTPIDGGYRACRSDDPADCRDYLALEFDDRNRLRTYSVGDIRLQSALLNREEASSESDGVKVSLIDGLEIRGQTVFAAEVTNQRAGEVAMLDFSAARYAAGEERFAAEVNGPRTLGPNESVTIAGFVDHERGVTLSIPVTFQDESGGGKKLPLAVLIRLN